MRSVKRLRDTAAVATDNSTAIITTNRFLALEALTSRVILLLTTNFSGGGWRQRCRASQSGGAVAPAPNPRVQFCQASQHHRACSAPARPPG